jgi:hypothetical protein
VSAPSACNSKVDGKNRFRPERLAFESRELLLVRRV